MMRFLTTLPGLMGLIFLTNCSKETPPSFTLLADSNSFKQSASEINTKIDILWVMDNSGSMRTSQENVANNFNSFIAEFKNKGIDFQMAVTISDSYRVLFGGNPSLSRFRDGTDQTSHTGVFVLTEDTPNLESIFLINILQGTSGSGDERAFQSFKTTLLDSANAGFIRDDAFLSIIIVSDEDDFSHNTSTYKGGQYNDPAIHPISHYIDFLSSLKSASTASQSFGVSAISIWDQPCLNELNDSWPGRRIGVRYEQIVDQTKGIKGSLCGDFAQTLQEISNNILQLSTQFYLNREPLPESLVVRVNDQIVQQDSQNGWTYNPENISIVFHGSSIPPQGATISVDFDPVTIK